MGIKDRRTRLLLSLQLLGGENLSEVNADPKFFSYIDLILNERTKGVISSLIKEGLIEKTEQGAYKLSEKGFLEIVLKFPFFRFLRKEWDGKWRIISYEIPEVKRHLRDRLRREMEGWGLGPWHRSFWITPHPIIENLRDLVLGKEEEKYIQAFEANHSFGDREILINKVWKTKELEKRYKELFKIWHDIVASQQDPFLKFKKITAHYVSLLKIDPGLPKELVGERWISFEAWDIFKEIKQLMYKS